MVYPPDGGLPFIEHRTRETALFAESEWGWSREERDAFIFPFWDKPLISRPDDFHRSAEVHVTALKAAGEEHVWHCVHGTEARARRETRRRDQDVRLEATVRELDSSEVFAREERRHLA